jgi:beta-glucosidase/6-phospho-beta-glucosidase/beta-galactosidase
MFKLPVQEFGSDIDYWITLNEPLMFIYGGYLSGRFPPNKKSPLESSESDPQFGKS